MKVENLKKDFRKEFTQRKKQDAQSTYESLTCLHLPCL